MTSPRHVLVLLACLTFSSHGATAAESPPALKNPKPLFDGRTLAGWEGNPKIWRVENGCLTGGSHTETVKENEFLATTRDYTNFIVRLKIKLTGTNGFINSGFQIRSQRVPNNSEMAGYQCDFGEPNWYGAVYDESRRNKLMASSDMKALRPVIKQQSWNDYVIRAEGSRITTWINGVMGVDYYEPDLSIPNYDWGKLGIQVHGGGKAVVQVKDISIEELPVAKRFIGAPEPKKGARASPLTPEEEHATFTLPPGFEIELVASEDMDAGFGKFVAIDWDLQGRLWTMTALEYPVDANETPEVARALYASRARDKVLVFDRDPKSPTGYASKPRVFADGLAIPLGILPYKNGVYVQHGPDIVFLSDTDGDGKADKREVILTGFGVQDSHLFPHQFTRAPGNWIWFAQGAFNYGKVKTTKGAEVQFDQTRMAKFRYDGSDFDITSQGPCNIWGLVLDGNGQAWIQEANDFGYPMMPFHEYANYPGCSQAQWKSYAPEFPGTATEFAMGGTGLSGLALSDSTGRSRGDETQAKKNDQSLLTSTPTTGVWPAPYAGQFYIANPITRKIQAIQVTPDGPRFRYQKLPDFVLSSDEWFRPVALRTGPDGCLYLVDWYNKIISHNEVPRNHPERDKKRGRIWRVKHRDVKPFGVPDFAKLSGDELIAKLGGPSLLQTHLAWQAITDRQMKEVAPKLKKVLGDAKVATAKRLASLWALEGLKTVDVFKLKPLFVDSDRNIRREALRAYGENQITFGNISDFERLAGDLDPEVRAEVLRTAESVLTRHLASISSIQISDSELLSQSSREIELMARLAQPPLTAPTMKSTQNGRTIKAGEAYDREFERYLVRLMLEKDSVPLAAFLNSAQAQSLPVENRLLASLALEPKVSSTQVAKLLPQVHRPPGDEELLRLAQFPDEPGVGDALKAILQKPETRTGALESLLRVRTKLDAAKLRPLLTDAGRELLSQNNPSAMELGTKLASAFQLSGVEEQLVRVLEQGWADYPKLEAKEYLLRPESLAALQALRELKSDRVDLFAKLADKGGAAEQPAAVAALAASRDVKGPQRLASLYPSLPAAAKKTAMSGLSSTRPGASALVKAVRSGGIGKDEIDGATFDKLQAVLGEDADLGALMQEMASLFRPVLRLNGEDNAWAETGLTLDGPFTVETWVKLDPGIDNNDGILGTPGTLDMNFFDGHFRVWVGGGTHDAIVAKKKTVPDVWTHLAVTRDAKGMFRIYQGGELDTDDSKPVPQKFEQVRIGWTAPAKGTAGWLSEFRIWNRERTAAEIRADFDRSFDGTATPEGLVGLFSSTRWGKPHSGAKVQKTQDFPPLLTETEAKALAGKFARFHALAEKPGDAAKGKAMFTTVCQQCHSVGGQGGQVGPVLNGAGALGVEALLRNILTPNAAMEPGYRAFRVELRDGDVLDGICVSENKDAIILRRPNVDDMRIAQKDVRKAGFTKSSMMPEGLLDALKAEEVSDLFAYLKTLK
jgi:putative membrane-bound dehydrogenase-like protein